MVSTIPMPRSRSGRDMVIASICPPWESNMARFWKLTWPDREAKQPICIPSRVAAVSYLVFPYLTGQTFFYVLCRKQCPSRG